MRFKIVFVRIQPSGYVQINPPFEKTIDDMLRIETLYIHPDDLSQFQGVVCEDGMTHAYQNPYIKVINSANSKECTFDYKTNKSIPKGYIGLNGYQLDMLNINYTDFGAYQETIEYQKKYAKSFITDFDQYYRKLLLDNALVDCVHVIGGHSPPIS
jgi:hypothetical protein